MTARVRGSYFGRDYAVDQNDTQIGPGDRVELQAEFYEGLVGTVVELDLRQASEGYSVVVQLDHRRPITGGTTFAFRPSEVTVL